MYVCMYVTVECMYRNLQHRTSEPRNNICAYVCMYVYVCNIYICIRIWYWRLMIRDLHYRTLVFSQYHVCNMYVYNMYIYIYIMYVGTYVPVYVYMVITRV